MPKTEAPKNHQVPHLLSAHFGQSDPKNSPIHLHRKQNLSHKGQISIIKEKENEPPCVYSSFVYDSYVCACTLFSEIFKNIHEGSLSGAIVKSLRLPRASGQVRVLRVAPSCKNAAGQDCIHQGKARKHKSLHRLSLCCKPPLPGPT
jgi:hypothetical protein